MCVPFPPRPRGRLRPLCMDSSFKRAFSRFAQCESAPLFLPLCPPSLPLLDGCLPKIAHLSFLPLRLHGQGSHSQALLPNISLVQPDLPMVPWAIGTTSRGFESDIHSFLVGSWKIWNTFPSGGRFSLGFIGVHAVGFAVANCLAWRVAACRHLSPLHSPGKERRQI